VESGGVWRRSGPGGGRVLALAPQRRHLTRWEMHSKCWWFGLHVESVAAVEGETRQQARGAGTRRDQNGQLRHTESLKSIAKRKLDGAGPAPRAHAEPYVSSTADEDQGAPPSSAPAPSRGTTHTGQRHTRSRQAPSGTQRAVLSRHQRQNGRGDHGRPTYVGRGRASSAERPLRLCRPPPADRMPGLHGVLSRWRPTQPRCRPEKAHRRRPDCAGRRQPPRAAASRRQPPPAAASRRQPPPAAASRRQPPPAAASRRRPPPAAPSRR